jgi:heme iron utilization protein
MAINPIRPADDTARALASAILRSARSGALATLDKDGGPAASLVLVATDMDGTPLILVSSLSAHEKNLRHDPRASLLLSRPGKGDPLAHPRLTIRVAANWLDRDSGSGIRARQRILARHPKSALYIDFPDFSLVSLPVLRASLNGGFGKAYELGSDDLVLDLADCPDLPTLEADVLAHMNDDHADAIALYATKLLGGAKGPWRMTGLDPEGCDLVCNDMALRLPFPERVGNGVEVRKMLVALAAKARQA